MRHKIKVFFEIDRKGSSLRQEMLAGTTIFLSMAYILSLQPQIISQTGMPFSACVTATVLVCFLCSLFMGVYAKSPIVPGPGLSLSLFFTWTLVENQGVPVSIALGATFWVGLIFFILSLFKVRAKLALAVPASLKSALVCGIGLFVAVMGLKAGGLIAHSKDTFLTVNPLTVESGTFLAGLALLFFLLILKIQGAFLISILLISLLCLPSGRVWGDKILLTYQGVLAPPDWSAFAQADLWGALHYSFWPVLFSIAFVDLFESLGSILGIVKSSPVLAKDEQKQKTLKKILLVDSAGTAWAGIAGSSSPVCFLESLAGIRAGGRTGLTALTAGILFLPFLFLSPLPAMIPAVATAPILLALGIYMMKSVVDIEWNKWDEALPAFAMILLIPLCFSIIQGIIYSFLLYTILKIGGGKAGELSPYMYVLTALCLVFLIL